jgi:hypothetical protein
MPAVSGIFGHVFVHNEPSRSHLQVDCFMLCAQTACFLALLDFVMSYSLNVWSSPYCRISVHKVGSSEAGGDWSNGLRVTYMICINFTFSSYDSHNSEQGGSNVHWIAFTVIVLFIITLVWIDINLCPDTVGGRSIRLFYWCNQGM